MLLLTDVSGLPLHVEEEMDNLRYDQNEVTCSGCREVSLMEIVHSLLNKSLRYPESVYSHHQRMLRVQDTTLWPENFTYDVMYIPAGLLGIEYIKTHIFHMSPNYAPAACVVQVLEGVLTLVLQKNKEKDDPFDIATCVDEARILQLRRGEVAVIPSGYYYTFINTQEVPVIFARVIGVEHIVDYQTLRRENGLAYYLISKNARQELVSNPRYRSTVDVKKMSVADLNSRYSYEQSDKPLYEQVKSQSHKFSSMLL